VFKPGEPDAGVPELLDLAGGPPDLCAPERGPQVADVVPEPRQHLPKLVAECVRLERLLGERGAL
jgi:hypothetical protein